ncbi:MAG: replication-relaxation family protein [Oscillospiraceae bacterium]|nr:replication-relaxation family protein [Oscillospiraceae bacterium]
MKIRITKSKLEKYKQVLSSRDKEILQSIQKCKFIKTDQIGRLHFGSATTPSAGLRAATRKLTKLHKMGLVQTLRRRIGGVRAGSTSYVWTLTTAGRVLLGEKPTRPYEPTYIFLKHTLAVSELYTRLYTSHKLMKADFEPTCWRKSGTLKPDLYAVTENGEFEDYWFFEVDLDTEAPSRIMRKCESYGKYCLSGIEQEEKGVFPKVVWLVPDEKRRGTLYRYIGEHLSEYAQLFAVITFDDLDKVVIDGAGESYIFKAIKNEGA